MRPAPAVPKGRPAFDTPCKLGTVPHLVRLHKADKVAVGRLVRVQTQVGARWSAERVTKVNPDGHFTAERWLTDVPASISQKALESGEWHSDPIQGETA